MKKYLLPVMILLFLSCSNNDESADENAVDCSLVDCMGGDSITMAFLKNGDNVLENDPDTEFSITQNNQRVTQSINTIENSVIVALSQDDPLTVNIDNKVFNIQLSSTFIEGECCSGIMINSIAIDGSTVCNDGECDNIIEINLD